MNLEAKARISWGKCSTQMDPATLLFSNDKSHARACENVDPKEHRALLGLAGASLSVHNVDMTLASEKNVAESRGTEHYDIPSKVSRPEEEHHCPSFASGP